MVGRWLARQAELAGRPREVLPLLVPTAFGRPELVTPDDRVVEPDALIAVDVDRSSARDADPQWELVVAPGLGA
jgi:hypothetical protein